MPKPTLAALLTVLCCAPAAFAADRLRMVYFHDEAKSQLVLRDLAFNGNGAGIAVGTLQDARKNKPAALVTTDGGRTWTPAPLPGHGFWIFMNRYTAWFGDGERVWHSEDLGLHWDRARGLGAVARVYFVDEARGWAIGPRKGFWETTDGGKRWTKVPAGDEPATRKETTTYNCIAFATEKAGMVTGYSRPRQVGRLPEWMLPESRPREVPTVTISFETRDQGKTWTHTAASLFGTITKVKLTPEGRGLALIEFFGEFPFASEVFAMNVREKSLRRSFRRADRSVTDVAFSGRAAWLVAVEPPGEMLRSPIPGKLKLLTSNDLEQWSEIEVDYRAVATRAALAWDRGRLWAATDTGMILSLPAE